MKALLHPIILTTICTIFLSSCASKKEVVLESEKPVAKPKIVNTLNLKRRWDTNIGSDFSNDSHGFQIKKDSNKLYAASESGSVKAIDLSNGNVIWKSKTVKLSAGVGVGKDTILVASDDGIVISLDKSSGKKVWEKQLSSEILTSPVESNNVVISRTLDGVIYGLSAESGEEKWSLSRNLPSLSLRRDVAPLILGSAALFGLSTGKMIAIDTQTGRVVWDVAVSIPQGNNPLERMRDIANKPVIKKGLLFVNSFQGDVIGVRMDQRKLLWRQSISSHTPLSIDNESLYISNDDSAVLALSQIDGSIKWRNEKLLHRNISAPYSIGNYLLVFGQENNAYLLDKKDGKILANYDLPGESVVGNPIIESSPQAGLIFSFVSNNGNLYSYKITK